MSGEGRLTSLEAFESLDLSQAETLKDAIVAALEMAQGTSADVARRLKVSEYAVSKRTSDLLKEGRIHRAAMGVNPSGRRAWVLGAGGA